MAMDKPDETNPNSKHYFKKLNLEEAKNCLQKCANENKIITLWSPTKGEGSAENYKSITYHEKENLLEVELQKGLLERMKGSENLGFEILFKSDDRMKQYFTKGELLTTDLPYMLHFRPSLNDFYMSQRRSNYRLNTHQLGFKLWIEIEGRKYLSIDISAGGTSIPIRAEQEGMFQEGQTVEDLVIHFRDEQLTIPYATIVNITPFKSPIYEDVRTKAGVQFVKLPVSIEEQLFVQINQEARYIEMKSMTLENLGQDDFEDDSE